MARNPRMQTYPRNNETLLAKDVLFPKPKPLPQIFIDKAIKNAFIRIGKNKRGEIKKVYKTPEELVNLCIKHLKTRSDPILNHLFFPEFNAIEIFDMDAIAYEMQRQRMTIGLYYQYLMVELIKVAKQSGKTNIINVFDGTQEGDVVADIQTPKFDNNLRIYMSVKKSEDTVGGQDFPGVVRRLENVAKSEKNLTSPYICVIAIATPTRGKFCSYHEGRRIKCNREGQPYSLDCEVWMPGFIYPYLTGLRPIAIYKESIKIAKQYIPFYTLKVRKEAGELLKQKFIDMGICDLEGKIDPEAFFNFVFT